MSLKLEKSNYKGLSTSLEFKKTNFEGLFCLELMPTATTFYRYYNLEQKYNSDYRGNAADIRHIAASES